VAEAELLDRVQEIVGRLPGRLLRRRLGPQVLEVAGTALHLVAFLDQAIELYLGTQAILGAAGWLDVAVGEPHGSRSRQRSITQAPRQAAAVATRRQNRWASK
jgi:hypothetical protein